MNILTPAPKHFTCEVCGQSLAKPTFAGIEVGGDTMLQISLCRGCGPVDFELMQLCREVTIGCSVN
jgi:hypothetical protein